jgi:hypothetical protein
MAISGAVRRGRLLLGLAACVVVAATWASPSFALGYTVNPDYVQFDTSSMGSLRVYTDCSTTHNTGPGYIAWWRYGSQQLIDDTASGQQDTQGSTAIRVPQGIGKFVYREARAPFKTALSYANNANTANTWLVDGSHCAGYTSPWGTSTASDTGVNPAGIDPNGDPYTHQIGPVVPTFNPDGSLKYAEMRYMVAFKDRYTPQLLTVTYVWRVWDDHVQMWSDVIENCSGPSENNTETKATAVTFDGSCGTPDAWIKGPKYIVGLGSYEQGSPADLPWSTIATNTTSGAQLCSANFAGGTTLGWACPGPTTVAPWNQANPDGSQPVTSCPGYFCWPGNPDGRAWVQFQPGGGCSASYCFNSVFRAYQPDGSSWYPGTSDSNSSAWAGITPSDESNGTVHGINNWISSGYNGELWGMDQWAQNEQLEGPQSSKATGGTTCIVDNTATQVTPYDYKYTRQWEAVGDKYTSPKLWQPAGGNWGAQTDPYTYAGYYFFAWRDCQGVETDQRDFRAPEGGLSNYGTYATFSLTHDGSLPPAING